MVETRELGGDIGGGDAVGGHVHELQEGNSSTVGVHMTTTEGLRTGKQI